ncbi:MAG: hypothetical protein ACOVRP_04700, partial [Gemmatimonas sp.]
DPGFRLARAAIAAGLPLSRREVEVLAAGFAGDGRGNIDSAEVKEMLAELAAGVGAWGVTPEQASIDVARQIALALRDAPAGTTIKSLLGDAQAVQGILEGAARDLFGRAAPQADVSTLESRLAAAGEVLSAASTLVHGVEIDVQAVADPAQAMLALREVTQVQALAQGEVGESLLAYVRDPASAALPDTTRLADYAGVPVGTLVPARVTVNLLGASQQLEGSASAGSRFVVEVFRDGDVNSDVELAVTLAGADVGDQPAVGRLVLQSGVTVAQIALDLAGDDLRGPDRLYTLAVTDASAGLVQFVSADGSLAPDVTLELSVLDDDPGVPAIKLPSGLSLVAGKAASPLPGVSIDYYGTRQPVTAEWRSEPGVTLALPGLRDLDP